MAIDPGPHTGFAVKLPAGGYMTATFMDIKQVWDLIADNKPEHVAVERFSTGSMVDGNMLVTIRQHGSIQGICHVLNIKVHEFQPQQRKSFVPEAIEMLNAQRRPGDWTPHERDALAHLLLLEYVLAGGKLK